MFLANKYSLSLSLSLSLSVCVVAPWLLTWRGCRCNCCSWC